MPRATFGPAVVALVSAVTLAACAGAASPSATTSPAGSVPGSHEPAGPVVWLPEWAADGGVPAEVATRRALPFCGVEKAPAPQPGEFYDRAVRLCFWNAHLAGMEAEFVSIQSTVEGARIATIYRLASDGTVEVLTDFTQDAVGGGTWQASTCATVVEGEGASLLGVDGCKESRALP